MLLLLLLLLLLLFYWTFAYKINLVIGRATRSLCSPFCNQVRREVWVSYIDSILSNMKSTLNVWQRRCPLYGRSTGIQARAVSSKVSRLTSNHNPFGLRACTRYSSVDNETRRRSKSVLNSFRSSSSTQPGKPFTHCISYNLRILSLGK